MQPGPPPRRAAVPGRGRPVGSSGPSPRTPGSPGGSRQPHPSGRRGGFRRGVPGAERARAGPLGAVRAGGGARPGTPRAPAGPANGRPAFGKIAIYGHVLGPRAPPPHARAPLRLNSGGGGRARSQSLQPPASRSAPLSPLALALCAPPPSQVSGGPCAPRPRSAAPRPPCGPRRSRRGTPARRPRNKGRPGGRAGAEGGGEQGGAGRSAGSPGRAAAGEPGGRYCRARRGSRRLLRWRRGRRDWTLRPVWAPGPA